MGMGAAAIIALAILVSTKLGREFLAVTLISGAILTLFVILMLIGAA